MSTVKVLDCTLRDGGYVNDWNFGQRNIRSMIRKLNDAHIDIIEVGFLEDIPAYSYDSSRSFFQTVEQIEAILPTEKKCEQFVAMARYGNLNVDALAPWDGKSIDGIRVTFHITEANEVLDFCQKIKDKGYKTYVQPVGTTMYTDEEIITLLKKVNAFQPYAFYAVDTLGVMHQFDIRRLFYLIDHNLDAGIVRGFHSHNNLQMSFSNAQALAEMALRNDVIIDASVHGMGRGAGNLHTELITENLNHRYGAGYDLDFLLEIIDDYMAFAKKEYAWGYMIPYYLAATKNCHPDYATYLSDKKTLQIRAISDILDMIPAKQREMFDRNLVQRLYEQYQSHAIDDSEAIAQLTGELACKNLLLLAPGYTLQEHAGTVREYIAAHDAVVVAINHIPADFTANYVFISNRRRFDQVLQDMGASSVRLISTSNINAEDSHAVVNYSSLTNTYPHVKDNATLMLIKLFMRLGIKTVSIAGFDGYTTNNGNRYVEKSMETMLDRETYENINREISQFLRQKHKEIVVEFVTPSIYIQEEL